ncbi:MAG: hypothetical protein NWE98_09965 [Candidatus Bathyarchaeota archaeon]|nr:hypothetical protein [Candidatus Bathyarchaeota archaeon]
MISKKQDSSQYDRIKEFQGKKYTGVVVGHGHKWQYKAGEWKEKKIRPDRWSFTYKVGKRRSGNAPEGSGAPVGTEYHWYIIADQIVKKLDANNYSTEMTGSKYKIAHKRAGKDTWSAPDAKQRKEMVKALKEIISELETTPETQATQNRAIEKKSRQTQLVFPNQ